MNSIDEPIPGLGWSVDYLDFVLGPEPTPAPCACEGEVPECFYCDGTGELRSISWSKWAAGRRALGVSTYATGTA